jgi:hypothetical protein
MPKHAMDYSNTIIYKLCCNDVTIREIYVGHTTNFVKRKSAHKYDCNTETSKNYNHNVYQFIRNNGGWINWSMIEIEKCSCNDGNEATARERHWVEELQAKLNSQVPNRTKQEYYQENSEKYKEQHAQYYEQNSETIKEQKKQYYAENVETIKEYAKQYYAENVETIKEYAKQYREQNAEQIKEKKNTKCSCECGGKFTLANKSQHMKSKMHQNFININNN